MVQSFGANPTQSFEHGLKALGSIPLEGWVQLVALQLGRCFCCLGCL
jgi:hypothetical protein